jgi:hypothetical protein
MLMDSKGIGGRSLARGERVRGAAKRKEGGEAQPGARTRRGRGGAALDSDEERGWVESLRRGENSVSREEAGVGSAAAGVDFDAIQSLNQQMPPVACSTLCTAHDPWRHLAGHASGVRSGARSETAANGTQRKGKAVSRKDKIMQEYGNSI